jgi:hypothetical protein
VAVRCANCGEELLGAVNRCWRCGATYLSLPQADGLPPVRRLPSELALEAELIPDLNADSHTELLAVDTQTAPSGLTSVLPSSLPGHGKDREGVAANRSLEPAIIESLTTPLRLLADGLENRPGQVHLARQGSPFRESLALRTARAEFRSGEPVEAERRASVSVRGNDLSDIAARLGVPLGLAALVFAAIFPLGGFLTACLGIAVSMWGSESRRWYASMLGLLCSCIAYSVNALRLGLVLYQYFTPTGTTWTSWLP